MLDEYKLHGLLLIRIAEHAACALMYYRHALMEVLHGVRCESLQPLLKESELPPPAMDSLPSSASLLGGGLDSGDSEGGGPAPNASATSIATKPK